MSWKHNRITTLLLMAPLVALYAFSLDLYLPLLPRVAEQLQATKVAMQYGNSIFMLVCGIGQLLFGPISDKFGRKPVLMSALSIYLIGAILLSFTQSLSVFIIARGLQALGSCGAYLCCFASIRDIFDNDNDSAEMFSYLNIGISLSSITAPALGALIGAVADWHMVFFILMIYACISILYCAFFYHETAPPLTSNNISALQSALASYKRVFISADYQVYTLPAAVGIGSFFSFYCLSSYLYQQVMGTTPLTYGLLYGSCGITFLIGSFLCGLTVKQYGIQKTLWGGLSCHMIGALIVTLSYLITGQNLLIPTHLGVLLIIFGSAYMISAGIGGTMAPFQDIAGAAFALISAYKFIFAQVLADSVMHFYTGTTAPFGIILIVANVTAASVLLLGRPYTQASGSTLAP